jgi:4-hydroxy-2-oxoheptanedioate aldolase
MKINLSDVRAAEIAAMCGFDCLWVCLEHIPNDYSAVENQIRAAKNYDTDVLVRVEKGCYSDYIKPLEIDAAGIMVPHLMSLEEAKGIVKMTRFHPVGRRPIDGGNVDGAYCMIPYEEYTVDANRERFVVVQIEDPEPLDELEEIAKLDGIDMLFFGPGDFSQGIGATGQWDNPLLIETRKRVVKVARENGKFAGTMGSLTAWDELVDMGYQFISIGADVVGLWMYFKDLMKKFDQMDTQDSAGQDSTGIYGKK